MTPPRARTWGRIGHTPVVRVRDRGSGQVSMAGMACYRPGERSRLIYAIREYRGREGEPKGFAWRDFRDLIVRARIQLGGPIVLVLDNARIHLVPPLKAFFEANAHWLTVFQYPPTHQTSTPRKALVAGQARHGNLATANLDQLTQAVKRKLKMIQYRPQLIDGCLTGTDLSISD
ncbi:transposase [Streptomyces sp. LUP30]|uniref:transposase n=1 Tax=Streptomyces sp. LUP30 TaxID=1890285 RepID=UPI000A50BB79